MGYLAMRGSAAVNTVSRPPWRREPADLPVGRL